MKIKNSLILFGLGAAFLVVSLWVFLSRGRNAKAVNAKFRIGGLILTISSLLSFSSCSGIFTTTCYDVAVPFVVDPTSPASSVVHVGDTLSFVLSFNPSSLSYKVETSAGQELQKGPLEVTDYIGSFTLAETEYRGEITVSLDTEDYNRFSIKYVLE